jgi:hypothetical protein
MWCISFVLTGVQQNFLVNYVTKKLGKMWLPSGSYFKLPFPFS